MICIAIFSHLFLKIEWANGFITEKKVTVKKTVIQGEKFFFSLLSEQLENVAHQISSWSLLLY